MPAESSTGTGSHPPDLRGGERGWRLVSPRWLGLHPLYGNLRRPKRTGLGARLVTLGGHTPWRLMSVGRPISQPVSLSSESHSSKLTEPGDRVMGTSDSASGQRHRWQPGLGRGSLTGPSPSPVEWDALPGAVSASGAAGHPLVSQDVVRCGDRKCSEGRQGRRGRDRLNRVF